MEDRVVAAAETFLNGQRPQHLSLHFDGCMVCGTTGEGGDHGGTHRLRGRGSHRATYRVFRLRRALSKE